MQQLLRLIFPPGIQTLHRVPKSSRQTAASMEELTSTVKRNAENAREASQLAVIAAKHARSRGKIVWNVVHTMETITESSKKITEIISVIIGISFQIKLLVLNAAVEAARR